MSQRHRLPPTLPVPTRELVPSRELPAIDELALMLTAPDPSELLVPVPAPTLPLPVPTVPEPVPLLTEPEPTDDEPALFDPLVPALMLPLPMLPFELLAVVIDVDVDERP